MVINKLREKLHDYINKYGINSSKTYEVSVELDEEIKKYYEQTFMGYYYKLSMDGLNDYIKENNKIPSISQWNDYAKQNDYLSSESMKYIERITLADNDEQSYSKLVLKL